MALVLNSAFYLLTVVSAAPVVSEALLATKTAATAASWEPRRPVLEIVRQGEKWLVEPSTVPPLPRSDSFFDRLKRTLGRSAIKITTQGQNVRIRNTGSSSRLVRFGSKNMVYIIHPKSTELVSGLTRQQLEASSVQKVKGGTAIHYHE
ncbi:uncharacterized protein MEPE_02443 [Melanopsichium pennsylvanicum]|uniref:Uncharacterized protein n=1 Tax=Melanopsichium pennsylvanicum TaxID=63383 RepID=A0AAJ4XKP2_9BASI|nr:uncharacterized protein MEPE_02443 [Melanopsichium pennsylvanicum]